MSFPAELTTPRAARQFVGDLLVDPAEELRQMALVLTSELVTNSVVHANTELDVRVELAPDHMRVEVTDGDPRPPDPAAHAPDELGGRGLVLVEALATAWGTKPCAGGKVVWFTLDGGRATGQPEQAPPEGGR